MPRKLKTFVTESGFFELAVAAPSMKAAETAPGTVLRRPIGSKQPFREGTDLPEVKGASRKSKAKSGGQGAARARAGTVDLRAIREARAALEAARMRHRKRLAALDRERETIERRVEWEEEDWRREKERLEEVIRRLKR